MDTLFHYCSAEAFLAIIGTRTLQLSSLTLSNDSMEGRLVSAAIERLAKRDQLGAFVLERLQHYTSDVGRWVDGLGFCLSEEGDLLSQWRGYADDGRGVSIGFSRRYLESLAKASKDTNWPGFTLCQVRYEPTEHDATVQGAYRQLKGLTDHPVFARWANTADIGPNNAANVREDAKVEESFVRAMRSHLGELTPDLFVLKSAAFREEREWRLISMLMTAQDEARLYRASAGKVIPYRAFPLSPAETPRIDEVVLGPRHLTPPDAVAAFLDAAGFGDVEVRRSSATYR